MNPDEIPLWVALAGGAAAFYWWIRLEFKAAQEAFEAKKASDPVVVTASGRPSNRYVRACKQEVVR